MASKTPYMGFTYPFEAAVSGAGTQEIVGFEANPNRYNLVNYLSFGQEEVIALTFRRVLIGFNRTGVSGSGGSAITAGKLVENDPNSTGTYLQGNTTAMSFDGFLWELEWDITRPLRLTREELAWIGDLNTGAFAMQVVGESGDSFTVRGTLGITQRGAT